MIVLSDVGVASLAQDGCGLGALALSRIGVPTRRPPCQGRPPHPHGPEELSKSSTDTNYRLAETAGFGFNGAKEPRERRTDAGNGNNKERQ